MKSSDQLQNEYAAKRANPLMSLTEANDYEEAIRRARFRENLEAVRWRERRIDEISK